MITDDDWKVRFREVYARGAAAWKAGQRSPRTLFDQGDAAFLATIGCNRQELFDFVEDEARYGEPDLATTQAVTSLRRDYFLKVQKSRASGSIASMESLPAKTDQVDGIAWLPRLIVKARLKLRGEMPPDLMYGCAGDRPFLREMNMTLPQFLQVVWDNEDNDRQIIDAVKKFAGR